MLVARRAGLGGNAQEQALLSGVKRLMALPDGRAELENGTAVDEDEAKPPMLPNQ